MAQFSMKITRQPGSLLGGNQQAAFLNSKDKLLMSLQEKMNKAWQLTVCTSLSKKQVTEACSVADGSVGQMRRVRRQLFDAGRTDGELAEMNWDDARREAEGKEKPDMGMDEAILLRAKGYARSISRAVKDRPYKDPEGFAMALILLDHRLPTSLMETRAWETYVEEDGEKYDDEDEDHDDLSGDY